MHPIDHHIHKWRLINYSFVFMIIVLTSLVSRNKIQKNLCFKVRLVGWLAERQKNNFVATIYEYGLYKQWAWVACDLCISQVTLDGSLRSRHRCKDCFFLEKLSIDDVNFGQKWWRQKWKKGQGSSRPLRAGMGVSGIYPIETCPIAWAWGDEKAGSWKIKGVSSCPLLYANKLINC